MKVQEIRKHCGIVCFKRFTFAQKRFCGAEGLENVINLSDFNSGILVKLMVLKY
jgi:peroxiredoxin